MKNRGHKKVPKQDEDTGYLQILLLDGCHLKNLENVIIANAITSSQIGVSNVIEFASSSCLGTFYDPLSLFLNYQFLNI